MTQPAICLSIIENQREAIQKIASEVDLFEVRLDILGDNWRDIPPFLTKPWIGCNRSRKEGGWGDFNPGIRIEALYEAGKAGASIIDLEYDSAGLHDIVPYIKRHSKCLLSYHNLESTPPLEKLIGIVEGQIKAGADICKVVTTAREFTDNIIVLKLIRHFPGIKIISFAMGEAGRTSRILSPLCGGYFTYACLEEGREAASGQISVKEMREIYSCLK
jgi:3-dehydroquinate dehydratase type I